MRTAAIKLNIKVVDLSSSVISFSLIKAAEKPESTKVIDNSKIMITAARRPKSSGLSILARIRVTTKFVNKVPALAANTQNTAWTD